MGTFDNREGHYQTIVDAKALTAINRAVVSTAMRITIGNVPIGYVQNLTENQNRPANPTYEIGSVEIIEHVPGQPAYTLSMSKLGVYRINFLKIAAEIGMKAKSETLYNAIKARINGDGIIDFSTLVEHAIPFDIKILERDPVGNRSLVDDLSPVIFTCLWEDCMITSYSKTTNASGNLTITENINLVARKPKFSSSGFNNPLTPSL